MLILYFASLFLLDSDLSFNLIETEATEAKTLENPEFFALAPSTSKIANSNANANANACTNGSCSSSVRASSESRRLFRPLTRTRVRTFQPLRIFRFRRR